MLRPRARHPRPLARTLALAALLLATPSCLRFPDPPDGQEFAVTRPVSAVPAPLYPDGHPYRSTDHEMIPIWIVAGDLHTGLVFPYDWLLESGYIPPAGIGNPPWVNMSWGDRTAYVQKEWLDPWQVFRALFTPTPAVMEMIPVRNYVVDVCQPNVIYRGFVKRENGPRLAAFLNHTTRMGADGKPIILGPSSWGGGYLLDNRYSYYLPRICNVWTAQALECCGCDMFLPTSLPASGVIRQATAPPNNFECVWVGNGSDTQPPNDTPVPGGATRRLVTRPRPVR